MKKHIGEPKLSDVFFCSQGRHNLMLKQFRKQRC